MHSSNDQKRTLEDHYQVFKGVLERATTERLIEVFNIETRNRGWVSVRGSFLRALADELKMRDIDSDVIFHANGLILKYEVDLIDGKLIRRSVIN